MDDSSRNSLALLGRGGAHCIYRYRGADPRLANCVLRVPRAASSGSTGAEFVERTLRPLLGAQYLPPPVATLRLNAAVARALCTDAPDAASLAPNATDLPIQLRLPDGAGSTPLTARLHASFGVRAWDPAIQMCIDSEDVIHVDPGRGQEMLVEGEALTNPVTLTLAGHSRPRPEPPLVAALSADRTLVTLRLGGRGADEIEDAAAISRDLEAPCN